MVGFAHEKYYSYEQEVGGRFLPFDTTCNLCYNIKGSEGKWKMKNISLR